MCSLWFNHLARKTVRKQRKLYDNYKRSLSDIDKAKYKQARRTNKKLFRKLERDYYNRVLYEPLIKGDSKPFYSFCKKKGGNNNQSSIVFKDLSAIQTAEIFNSYFQSVFSKGDSRLIDYERSDTNIC